MKVHTSDLVRLLILAAIFIALLMWLPGCRGSVSPRKPKRPGKCKISKPASGICHINTSTVTSLKCVCEGGCACSSTTNNTTDK